MESQGGAAWRVVVETQGVPDPRTGYLVGIDRIDAAVREEALPLLIKRYQEKDLGAAEAVTLIHQAVAKTMKPPPSATMLCTEPMTWWRIESNTMSKMVVRRRYEFSASHRLHLPELDEDANRELFGKCSNVHGHGHNYEVEVQVSHHGRHDAISIPRLDEIVNRVVIDRFDHKHLNLDLEDFRDRVPSVENITARCVELLREPILDLPAASRLDSVTVWETPRTACTVCNPSS